MTVPVTTVTFEEKGGKTLLVLHELYPSKEALDAAGTGAADAMPEQFEQLDELLVTPGRERGTVMKSSISRSAAWLFTLKFFDLRVLCSPSAERSAE